MAHPFICPACNRRTGLYDIATGISLCARCGTTWKGPKVHLLRGDATEEEIEAFVSEVEGGEKEGEAGRSGEV